MESYLFEQWLTISLALSYLGILFVIAYFGEKKLDNQQSRPWIYSLSLAVYCTSWAMYGTVGQSHSTGWFFAPTYVGTILIFLFAWPVLLKIIQISKRNNITSIADFIASRFGKSHLLGGLVALICVIAITPYIALQIKAIVNSFLTITSTPQLASDNQNNTALYNNDIGLYTVLVLAFFTILFGTRKASATDHQPGVMMAIAFESLIKLGAFILVGVFSVYFVFDGFKDLFTQGLNNQVTAELITKRQNSSVFLSQVFLGATAIICLPKQFHVLVVENRSKKELLKSRWIFPAYLFLINLFILPIAIAGSLVIGDNTVTAEKFSLIIPMTQGAPWISLIAFIGGISAATGMIIVATIVLSTMISNEVLVPFALKFRSFRLDQSKSQPQKDLSKTIQNTRRVVILVVLFFSYLFYKTVAANEALSTTGLISMALVAQLAPAIILGIYWKSCHKTAVIIGLVTGLIMWFYTLLLPVLESANIFESNTIETGLFGFALLKPTEFLGLYGFDSITHGLIWSFGLNVILTVYLSTKFSHGIDDKVHTNKFLSVSEYDSTLQQNPAISNKDLKSLALRFIGREKAEEAFKDFCKAHKIKSVNNAPSKAFYHFVEEILQSMIGATSTRLIFETLDNRSQAPLEKVVELIDEATDVLKFNRELLQSAVENISQGISVVDKDLRLVAWNKQYQRLFDYPEELLKVGRPIEDLIRYNAQQGKLKIDDLDGAIEKRLSYMKVGSPHVYERHHDDGLILELKGTPMPGGGFVTSFIDITEFRNQQSELELVNKELEQRVSDRTKQLETLNQQYLEAKSMAELANHSKTRFLAAASHDVLQPLNAASLFSATLLEQASTEQQKNLSKRIQLALHSAEQLLKDLIDISKLDSGNIKPTNTNFSIAELMKQLAEEVQILAQEKGIELRCVYSDRITHTDRTMLRRVLQNLLTNAVKHSNSDRILFGCRRHIGGTSIHIIDNGRGIVKEQQEKIFREFVQLDSDKIAVEGHGLGLAIVSRILNILKLPLDLKSVKDKGSNFFVSVPQVDNKLGANSTPKTIPVSFSDKERASSDKLILCVDNEQDILDGMQALLSSWGYKNSLLSLDGNFEKEKSFNIAKVALILADYHLADRKTGIETIKRIRQEANWDIPAVVITADQTEPVKNEILESGSFVLHKPIRPLSLRTLLNKLMR